MISWSYQNLCGKYSPRQFEYHPTGNSLIFGTMKGEVCSVDNMSSKTCSITNLGVFGHKQKSHDGSSGDDPILGLCWFRQDPQKYAYSSILFCFNLFIRFVIRFIVGSQKGRLTCGTTAQSGIVKEYSTVKQLTSVHLNADDSYLLTSGFTESCQVFDVEQGTTVREYENIHNKYINISRFTNKSKNIFATSSFDGDVKLWDLRCQGSSPSSCIYTVKSPVGIVVMSFSPDDEYFLTSGQDNAICQYLSVDGRCHLKFDIPQTGLSSNYTRGYYNASGGYVYCGSCEEDTVKVISTSTGKVVMDVAMYPGRVDDTLYVQVCITFYMTTT